MRTPGSDTPNRRRRAVRALSLTGALGALLTPVVLAGASSGAAGPVVATTKVVPAVSRASEPPNVTYPIAPAAGPTDLVSFRGRYHHGTEIVAPCGTPVIATHPGTARVTSHKWSGPALVKVSTTPGRLTTWYGFMRKATVSDGQIVQAGQQLGEVGALGTAKGCELHLEVRTDSGRTMRNPSSWLERYVGVPVPTGYLFGNRGFVIATLNILGASHTDPGGDAPGFPGWDVRLPKAVATIKAKGVDVAGLQEFQKRQHAMFRDLAGDTYAAYPADERTDTDNSIIWRRSAFDLVHASTFDVTYFNGTIRHMPYVLLKQRSTGLTAYFINVHNPANTHLYHHQEKWRAQAIQTERALIVRLRASGRPVFLTGDLNDRELAFCPLTAGKLMLAPNSVPSTDCAPPPQPWIDWLFAAGPARFATYDRDWVTRDNKITDHPIVYSRAHLAG
ncbi:MAG: peptidoglycan DD-metalloendopeptidase family protein [Marmoricola sp.]